jgi:hypothetical protein
MTTLIIPYLISALVGVAIFVCYRLLPQGLVSLSIASAMGMGSMVLNIFVYNRTNKEGKINVKGIA